MLYDDHEFIQVNFLYDFNDIKMIFNSIYRIKLTIKYGS